MITRRLFFVLLISALPTAAADPVIIDTDAGTDDLIALAFLLARPDVRIEAITIAYGLAHVDRGAANVLRLLALAGRPDIPVYVGLEQPLLRTAPFPAPWRKISDELPGVVLPQANRPPERQGAAVFLATRLGDRTHPAVVLATGALTNLAQAFQRDPSAAQTLARLVIMGGALHVPGNLGDGGLFQTRNKTAEWNIFIDPRAAQIVLTSGARIDVVPLDATSKVPIDANFVQGFRRRARGPLAQFVEQVLAGDRESIDGGYFQAWDPLAAAALLDAGVVVWKTESLAVTQTGDETGRTTASSARSGKTRVAVDADAARFRSLFLNAFAR